MGLFGSGSWSSPWRAPTGGFLDLEQTGLSEYNDIFDPLDLTGRQAERSRDQIGNIQRQSARDSIAAQQAMMDQYNALYKPYRDAAGEAWESDFGKMMTGTEDPNAYSLSPQYLQEVDRNTTAVNRSMAAKGAIGSSGRGAAIGDVLLNAGQNESARQYGRQLDMQRLGLGAVNALGQAGRTAGANVGQTYGNLGGNMNTMYQNYGQQRQNSMNQGANALYGLGSYMGGR